ncbi:hypothetical protein AGMMS49940_20560 [Spirochaetia bacterium]|nr:hypothetical protein AGMMS49940_20560 [Spirochaetia bacterium]
MLSTALLSRQAPESRSTFAYIEEKYKKADIPTRNSAVFEKLNYQMIELILYYITNYIGGGGGNYIRNWITRLYRRQYHDLLTLPTTMQIRTFALHG